MSVEKVATPGQVRQKLKQVLYRHLQRKLRNNFKKLPESCKHNRKESLGKTGQYVGVCRHPNRDEGPRGRVCDSRVFGCDTVARMCSWWAPLRHKDDIKTEFRDFLRNSSRGQIAAEYPDAAALMWVLDGSDLTEDFDSLDAGWRSDE